MEYGGVLTLWLRHPSSESPWARNEFSPCKLSGLPYAELAPWRRADSGFGLRVNTFLGSGWGRLLSSVPVIQYSKKKDGRHAGQSASDKENAVGVNEAVRGAQAFDFSAGKAL
jgi:hypothetical protein